MDTLLNRIKSLGIQLEITNALPQSVNGFYYRDDVHDIIVINNAIKSEVEFKAVLSHELGHYFTTEPHYKSNSFLDIIHTERDEIRAIRWSCDYLIPNELLLRTLSEASDMQFQSLTDYFEIPAQLLEMKFYFMSLISHKWQLDDSKCLLLSALPSIYVVEVPSDTVDTVDDAFWCSEKMETYLQNPACHNIKVIYKMI
ncbi:ImmA/IrrE family metallo-endopeptidase [Fusibacter ferrireducens]|uniref:ImmA/IrrE family metallo-endopeptidase n=1 Tax=Fusibacter ferrireducens TaxID=2785058 RepID=A0ABR9ZV72_9FIRM|nr:ImmA/IrrE family metallo-endopeptidase [Fusibacter ferrireducens]MBF4693886.1 ImmA/IrrE family metallo-endopeptidase [Fusibacter ferrireducens]